MPQAQPEALARAQAWALAGALAKLQELAPTRWWWCRVVLRDMWLKRLRLVTPMFQR